MRESDFFRDDYVSKDRLIKDFDEMVEIFNSRELVNEDFPSRILTESVLRKSLNPKRISAIRKEIVSNGENCKYIKYFAPWNNSSVINSSSVEFVLSHCVLEHVDELENCYSSMIKWLKNGGIASHSVDFKCHNFTRTWNGHWAYSMKKWQFIKGDNAWAINRIPASQHLELAKSVGFNVLQVSPTKIIGSGISRNDLSSEFTWLTDEDLTTSHFEVLLKKQLISRPNYFTNKKQ